MRYKLRSARYKNKILSLHIVIQIFFLPQNKKQYNCNLINLISKFVSFYITILTFFSDFVNVPQFFFFSFRIVSCLYLTILNLYLTILYFFLNIAKDKSQNCAIKKSCNSLFISFLSCGRNKLPLLTAHWKEKLLVMIFSSA